MPQPDCPEDPSGAAPCVAGAGQPAWTEPPSLPPVLLPLPESCGKCGAAWAPTWTECPVCSRIVLQPVEDAVAPPDSTIGATLSLYLVLLACSILHMIAVAVKALSPATGIISIGAFSSLVIVLWVLHLRRQVGPGLQHTGSPWWYPASVAMGCLTFAVAWSAMWVLVHVLHPPTIRLGQLFVDAGYGWPVLLLVICVQPAVFEELVFRGVVLGTFRGLLGERVAILVSAMLFMVLHLTPLSFPHLLLLGLVLGYVRTRSGSLYPCMVLHFTHNLLAVLADMNGG